ncbi:hypothetical protein CPB83DRAFT_841050 [Crepidotus variabilis]|uniref:Uncharacterized protein n=1 Tax=Crepidotus variabilis TaxID=179855 RepID=A0A9P6E391_9AGAR|nr:hypothetical protein CPB83DRAFT_841050 [Crepidotus variabilis]
MKSTLEKILELVRKIDVRSRKDAEKNSQFQGVMRDYIQDGIDKEAEDIEFKNNMSRWTMAIMAHLGVEFDREKIIEKVTSKGGEAGSSKGPETMDGEKKGEDGEEGSKGMDTSQ